MSMVTLLNGKRNFVATGQLVYDSTESQELTSLVEKAKALDELLENEKTRIEQSCDDASVRGYRNGYEKGKSEARRKLSQALLASQRVRHQETTQVKDQAVQLALDIIRRIGLELGDASCVSMLANRCADDLMTNDTIKLHVNSELVSEVAVKLESLRNSSNSSLIEVVDDASLEGTACVLSTNYGTVHAGLEEQLTIIQRSLCENPVQEGSDNAE